jgi:hypothetical protein
MAIGPRTWTVLPHSPIEALAPNVWRVEGVLNSKNTRVMTLVRLCDGRILMHNAIALDGPSMDRIDRWGEVTAILIPNRFHRRDARIMQGRYRRAKVYAPRAALSAASSATPCAGTYRDVPSDPNITVRELAGIGEREGVIIARSTEGTSAIFCDTLLNLPKVTGLLGFFLHPTGTLAVPRPTSLVFAKDRKALRRDLESIAEEPALVCVVPGHGDAVSANASERLREAAGRL